MQGMAHLPVFQIFPHFSGYFQALGTLCYFCPHGKNFRRRYPNDAAAPGH